MSLPLPTHLGDATFWVLIPHSLVENSQEFSSIPVYFTLFSDPGKLYPVKPESLNTLAEPFICLADPK